MRQRYHDSDNFHIGIVHIYVCRHCPFEGDEMAMIDHAQHCGHIAQPLVESVPERRTGQDRRDNYR